MNSSPDPSYPKEIGGNQAGGSKAHSTAAVEDKMVDDNNLCASGRCFVSNGTTRSKGLCER